MVHSTSPNRFGRTVPFAVCALFVAAGCALLMGSHSSNEKAAEQASSLAVTYLGNEGFLIESAGVRVLVDALQGPGIPGYTTLPTEKRKQLESGGEGYEEIDLILISHVHPDHFNAESVSRFMKAVPGARVVSTPEVKRRLSHDPNLAGRVTALEPKAGTPQKLNVAGVDLTAFNMHHGRAKIQNLAFHVQMAGGSWLHVGDSALNLKEWQSAKLPQGQTDLFLCPYWHLLGADTPAILDVVSATTIVPAHLPAVTASKNYFAPAASRDELLQKLSESAPNVVMMDRLLGSQRFAKKAR